MTRSMRCVGHGGLSLLSFLPGDDSVDAAVLPLSNVVVGDGWYGRYGHGGHGWLE